MLLRRKLRIRGMAALAAISCTPLAIQPGLADGGEWLCLSETRGNGPEVARLPLKPDGIFSLSFIHSVSDTPVTDIYRVEDGKIEQIAEIFEAHGAGLPSIADDVGATGWRHENGRFIIEMTRPTGPIPLRIQAQFENTLHVAGTDLPLADLGYSALTLARCDEERPH
ncbi:DUF1850 domain-containing protein [Paracoccus alkanivorans]|uniref:DUF1850 domain-containing protein n=1 Tax=Paracoccus alkanivorans TaxID=2116655 RepID=A0A3M0N0N0_9RHOB|nr:DUF1850 domain-containing protein [Paracoccus alkanivorans]RMC37237.1 DUF1850 domain-containing protein [Paracoccus alkanivorans]